jgi:hypothetical protein
VPRLFISPKILIAVTVAALALSTAIAWGQKTDPLVGKWKMLATTPDGSQIPWGLTITYANGKYGATASSPSNEGEGPVKDLTVDGSKVHFRVPYEGEDYDIDLKLDGNSLVGTWSGNGETGQMKGEKITSS